MKITTITLLLAFIGSIALSSCSKYEDGPPISLRSKKERLTNTWRVDKAMENGSDVTGSFDQYELQMLSNNAATLAALYSLGDFNHISSERPRSYALLDFTSLHLKRASTLVRSA